MRFSLGIVIVLLISSSCEYTPHGDYKKIITQTSNIPPIKINFNEATDTILMFRPIEFYYTVTGIDPSRNYRITTTTSLAGSSSTTPIGEAVLPTGSFTLQPFTPHGLYQLEMTVSQPTGSGSLADQAGVEQIVFTKKLFINCDVDAKGTYFVTGFTESNGRLKVSWDKYTRINFTSYFVTKQYIDTSGFYSAPVVNYTITDPNQNFLIDSTFVGGPVIYSINVRTITDPTINTFDTKTYTEPVSQISKYERQTDASIKVYWRKCRYYSNFTKYDLRIFPKTLKSTSSINDTSAVLEIPFGNKENVMVRVSSEKGAWWNNNYYTLTDPHPFHFDMIQFGGQTGLCYYTSLGYADIYDPVASQRKPDSVSVGNYGMVSSSPTGNAVSLYHDMTLYNVNPVTLQTLSSTNVTTFPGVNSAVGASAFAVSDQGTVVIQSYYSLGVYNLTTKASLGQLNTGPNPYNGLVFSSDGQYFIATGQATLFQVSGGNITLIKQYSAATFDAGNANQIFVFDYTAKQFQILDLATRNILNQYNLPSAYTGFDYMLIDPITHWAVLIHQDRMIVYDFVNAVEKFSAPSDFSYGLALYNGTLYSGGAARLKLN